MCDIYHQVDGILTNILSVVTFIHSQAQVTPQETPRGFQQRRQTYTLNTVAASETPRVTRIQSIIHATDSTSAPAQLMLRNK